MPLSRPDNRIRSVPSACPVARYDGTGIIQKISAGSLTSGLHVQKMEKTQMFCKTQ
jgi:hypothetical protein